MKRQSEKIIWVGQLPKLAKQQVVAQVIPNGQGYEQVLDWNLLLSIIGFVDWGRVAAPLN